MQDSSNNSSQLIKEKLKETGVKQIHLAKKLGISPQHLNKILAKNQDKSQYLPKIAEILGLSTRSNSQNTKSIPIVDSNSLKSILDGSILFNELAQICLNFWPTITEENNYSFGFVLVENITSQLCKNDLLIFTSSIPRNILGRIGIAFIKDKGLIFVGKLKYNEENIIIFNERDCLEFKIGDQLIGIAVYLERNLLEEI